MSAKGVLLAIATLFASLGTACADEYPAHRITVIAPFPAGSSPDTVTRIVTKKMAELLKQELIVMNVPGALGMVGVLELLKAPPNGYVICLCNDGPLLTVMADKLARDKTPPYYPEDFTPIGQAVEVYYAIIAHKDLPVGDFAELAQYVRAHPGELNFASASPTSEIITGLEKYLFGQDAFVEVKYHGSEPKAVLDLLSGRVHVMAATSFTALPLIETGSVKVLGTIGKTRSPYVPNVPTLEEQTPQFREFHALIAELKPWNSLVGPRGLPEPIVKKLTATLKEALGDPEVIDGLTKARLGIRYGDDAELGRLFQRLPILTDVLRRAGTKLLD